MSSLGIFNKETKTYQKVAGTAEAAVVDTEMSDTSTNTVQNKVIKKYVDEKRVNIDGITLTLDEAKNVIKLADALKDKIGSALQPESIANNQVTTETGFALDARQANPNIDGTLAKQVADLNGRIENDCSIYWSGVETIESSSRTWSKGNKYITLQPGTYIIGLKAEADCRNDIYIDTKIDTNAENFTPYEKTCILPPSNTQIEIAHRSLSYSFPWKIDQTTTLFPFVYMTLSENVTCEIFAIKLK